MLDRYYNLFDAAKRHEDLLFRAGDALQARELNELQSLLSHRLAGLGNAIFKDGDLVDGADIVVDPDTGNVTLTAGKLYLRGMVREVAAAALVIPVDQKVAIGVRYTQSSVTELEDVALRDPAVGTENYGEPGAGRTVYALVWGWEGEGTNDGGAGQFHAVFTVTNGVLDNREAPPALDAVTAALARYDRDANGNYVTEGLSAAYLSFDADRDEFVFSLSEGRANINGYKIDRPQGARLRYPFDPDLQVIESEPHVFTGGAGSMRVELNRAPIHAVTDVKVTKERTVAVTHGAFTNASDTLPDSTVVQILEVKQGATTYAQGTSWLFAGDEIDWSPGGAEPAPGSSYTVKYRYIESVAITGLDDDGFTVSGVVDGTTMHVDYSWRLPRIDVLAINAGGEVSRLKGVAQVRSPLAPIPPAGSLALASIAYDWRTNAAPTVRNIAIRAIPMADIEDMRGHIGRLYHLVANQNLRTDASIREAGVKKGVFVDAFLNDDNRDVGTAQTAAIVGGAMTLPIGLSAIFNAGSTFVTLDYTLTPVLSQTLKTGFMLVNPYQAFEPVPSKIRLSPAVDEWTVVDTVFTSDSTTQFVRSGHFVEGVSRAVRSDSSVSDEVVGQSSVAARFLRQINVAYTVDGFDPGETLASLKFDGIDLTPNPKPTASGQGVLTGSFQVPANIPQGSKRVEFLGEQGNYGVATYVGRGTITTITRRQIVTINEYHVDPLAQTFTLDDACVLQAVDLWFTAKGGDKDVIVQIRDTTVGIPARTVLSEGRIPASAIILGGAHTRIQIDPIVIEPGREYAVVVMTDDPNHAVAVAQLGRFDPTANTGGWVTKQPYQIGVLLSSSNAVTWTPHQDRDLTFRLMAAEYTGGTKEVVLGTYNLTNASDLLTLAAVDRPAASTDVEFTITDANGKVHKLSEMQPLNLSDRISGNVTVKAVLTGGGRLSPVLYPDIKTVVGNMEVTADYVSRAFPAGAAFNVSVTLDTLLPGTATVAVYAESVNTGNWVQVPFDSGAPLDDGYQERTFKVTGLTGIGADKMTRVRVVLTGSPANRPFLKNLRAITL